MESKNILFNFPTFFMKYFLGKGFHNTCQMDVYM